MNSEDLWREIRRQARAGSRQRAWRDHARGSARQEEHHADPEERKPIRIVLNEHTCRECGKRLWIQPGLERMACDCGAVAWDRRPD